MGELLFIIVTLVMNHSLVSHNMNLRASFSPCPIVEFLVQGKSYARTLPRMERGIQKGGKGNSPSVCCHDAGSLTLRPRQLQSSSFTLLGKLKGEGSGGGEINIKSQ